MVRGAEFRPGQATIESSLAPSSTPAKLVEKRREKFGDVLLPAVSESRPRGRRGGRGGRGGRGRGFGRGRGRGRYSNRTLIVNKSGNEPQVSKQSLDDDLETYFRTDKAPPVSIPNTNQASELSSNWVHSIYQIKIVLPVL